MSLSLRSLASSSVDVSFWAAPPGSSYHIAGERLRAQPHLLPLLIDLCALARGTAPRARLQKEWLDWCCQHLYSGHLKWLKIVHRWHRMLCSVINFHLHSSVDSAYWCTIELRYGSCYWIMTDSAQNICKIKLALLPVFWKLPQWSVCTKENSRSTLACWLCSPVICPYYRYIGDIQCILVRVTIWLVSFGNSQIIFNKTIHLQWQNIAFSETFLTILGWVELDMVTMILKR